MSIEVNELLDEIRAPKKRYGPAILAAVLVVAIAVGGWIYVEDEMHLSDSELGVLSTAAARIMSLERGHKVSSLEVWNKMVSRTGKKSSKDFNLVDRIESARYLIGLIDSSSNVLDDQVSDPYLASDAVSAGKPHYRN